MSVSIIAAMDKNRLIGKDGKLPWNIPEDLKRFKELTKDKIVVMGRKTYESIGKPLKDRINIVISQTYELKQGDAILLVDNFEYAMHFAKAMIAKFNYNDEIMIIGGQSVYQHAIPHANKLYLTEVVGDYSGDTWFPPFNIDSWNLISEEQHDTHVFRTYEKKKKKEEDTDGKI